MAGGRPPRPGEVDGISLAPLLQGKPAPGREALYWHYPHYSNQGGVPSGAVRDRDWKLIEFYEDGSLELYNLRDDPGERRNLIAREPKRATELHEKLKRWRSSAAAAMPSANPDYDPAAADQKLTGHESRTPAAP